MKPRGQPMQETWNKIPDGIDILVTHGPPLGTVVCSNPNNTLHQCAYSLYCSHHIFSCFDEENLFDNQKLLQLHCSNNFLYPYKLNA